MKFLIFILWSEKSNTKNYQKFFLSGITKKKIFEFSNVVNRDTSA